MLADPVLENPEVELDRITEDVDPPKVDEKLDPEAVELWEVVKDERVLRGDEEPKMLLEDIPVETPVELLTADELAELEVTVDDDVVVVVVVMGPVYTLAPKSLLSPVFDQLSKPFWKSLDLACSSGMQCLDLPSGSISWHPPTIGIQCIPLPLWRHTRRNSCFWWPPR